MTVVVTSKPTKSDIARARLGSYFRSRFVRVALLVSVALGLLGTVVTGGGAAVGTNVLVAWYPLALLLVLLPFGVALAGLWSPTVRAIAEQGIVYSFSAERIDIRSPAGTAGVPWITFKRAFETPNAIVVTAAGTTIVLPKRCFARVDDEAAVRALLVAKGLLS